jgi:hypothetical protein
MFELQVMLAMVTFISVDVHDIPPPLMTSSMRNGLKPIYISLMIFFHLFKGI